MSGRSSSKAMLELMWLILLLCTLQLSSIRQIGSWRVSRRTRLQVVCCSFNATLPLSLILKTAFIDWVKKEIDYYCEMFRKQVFSADVDPKVVEEAKNITYAQSKKVEPLDLLLEMDI